MQTIHPHLDSLRQQATDIEAAYRCRLQSLQLQMRQAQSRQRTLLLALAVLLFGGGITVFHAWHLAVTVAATGIALLLRRLFSLRKDLATDARLSDWYERGINRIHEKWQGQRSGGQEFARPRHPYASDLNILGTGSIFELLATTRSAAGAERLTAFLLDAARHRNANIGMYLAGKDCSTSNKNALVPHLRCRQHYSEGKSSILSYTPQFRDAAPSPSSPLASGNDRSPKKARVLPSSATHRL